MDSLLHFLMSLSWRAANSSAFQSCQRPIREGNGMIPTAYIVNRLRLGSLAIRGLSGSCVHGRIGMIAQADGRDLVVGHFPSRLPSRVMR